MNNQLVRFGLPMAVIVALVFGVTYVSQIAPSTGRPKPAPVVPTAKINAPPLIVPLERASWDPDEPPDLPISMRYGKEMEAGAEGHYDFWIANVHDIAANIQLMQTSCKCAEVQLGIVDRAAVGQFLADQSPAVQQPFETAAVEKLLAVAAKHPTLIQKVEWKPLIRLDTESRVPPADAKNGITFGVVRLRFHPKDPGALLILAEVNHAGGNDNKIVQNKFEVPVAIVPAVMMYPTETNIGEVRSGDVRKIDFVFWSATRDTFPIKLPELPEDPTYVFSKPEPLDGLGVVTELRRMKAHRPGSKPRAGYKLSLTINENLNDRLLELGPLHRRLIFNPGTEYESMCEVKGVVVGDVRLLDMSGASADRVKLGEFAADRPFSKSYNLQAFQPGVKFRIVSVTPAALTADLREKSAASQLWELKIDVAKDSMAGPLPYSSSVVLETVGPKARRIRVPVEGNAMIR